MNHTGHMMTNDHASMNHSGHMMIDNTNMAGKHGQHEMMGNMNMNHSGMGMAMAFHAGYTETILFKQWSIDSIGGLIGSMVGIFILSMLYEGLKYYREYLYRLTYTSIQYASVTVPTERGGATETHKAVQARMLSGHHFFQTFLHVVQVVLSYFLMLIFMTYNVWLCLAVVLGAGLGFFVFGWKKSVVVDVTEHCH